MVRFIFWSGFIIGVFGGGLLFALVLPFPAAVPAAMAWSSFMTRLTVSACLGEWV